MHPKSVLFMGTICPLAAIFASVGRSSHRSRLARRGVRTRCSTRVDSIRTDHIISAPRGTERGQNLSGRLFSMTYTHTASRSVKYEKRAPHDRSRRGR